MGRTGCAAGAWCTSCGGETGVVLCGCSDAKCSCCCAPWNVVRGRAGALWGGMLWEV